VNDIQSLETHIDDSKLFGQLFHYSKKIPQYLSTILSVNYIKTASECIVPQNKRKIHEFYALDSEYYA
jgi:hypothetical protein